MKEKETPLWASKTFWLGLGLIVGLIMLAFLFPNIDRVVAGPVPAPTAVAATAGGNDWIMVNYLATTNTIDIDISGNSVHDPAYSVVDMQYVVDVLATYNNTATCYLDFSNDSTDWTHGPRVINSIGASGTDMNQYAMFGRYSYVTCTLSNTNEITLTLIGKLSQN